MEHIISVIVFDQEDANTLNTVAVALKEYRSVLVPCA
jgi:hypothetical protein